MKDEELPTEPEADTQDNEPDDDEIFISALGWVVVALVAIPVVAITAFHMTTSGVVLSTGIGLCVVFTLAAFIGQRSSVVRAIGLGILKALGILGLIS